MPLFPKTKKVQCEVCGKVVDESVIQQHMLTNHPKPRGGMMPIPFSACPHNNVVKSGDQWYCPNCNTTGPIEKFRPTPTAPTAPTTPARSTTPARAPKDIREAYASRHMGWTDSWKGTGQKIKGRVIPLGIALAAGLVLFLIDWPYLGAAVVLAGFYMLMPSEDELMQEAVKRHMEWQATVQAGIAKKYPVRQPQEIIIRQE